MSCQLQMLATLLLGQKPLVHTNRRLSSHGHSRKQKSLFPLLGIKPGFLCCLTCSLVTILRSKLFLAQVSPIKEVVWLLYICTTYNYLQLRLLYECYPMAYILTQADGLASNGTIPILDTVPESIHQRSPIFLGSREDVEDVLQLIKKHSQ